MTPKDGYALLEEVRDRFSQVPVVLMSSFCPPEAAERALQAGAAGFLSKPFTLRQLLDAVASALRLQKSTPPRDEDSIE